jgi:serine/threonine protein kinase
MPPEFIQRQIITKAFDIYSLGIIFIELVTGTRVGFRDTNFLEISSAVIVEQVSVVKSILILTLSASMLYMNLCGMYSFQSN